MKAIKLQLATLAALVLCMICLSASSPVHAAHTRPRKAPMHGRSLHEKQHVQDQQDLARLKEQAQLLKERQKQIIKRNQYNPHRPKPTKTALAKRQNASGAPQPAATVTTGTSTLTFSRPTTITTTIFAPSTFTSTFYSTRYSTIRNCLLVVCATTTSTILVPTSTSTGVVVVPTATSVFTSGVPATTTFTFTSTLGQPAVTTAATNDNASFCPRCTSALVAAYLPILGCVCI